MATTTHGYQQVMRTGKGDGGDDVSRTGAAHNQRRPPIDHRAEDLATGIIALVIRAEQFATQPPLEGFDNCSLKHSVRAYCRSNSQVPHDSPPSLIVGVAANWS